MKIYVNYNITSGAIVTRYVEGIHDDLIAASPTGTANLEVSEADAALTMSMPGYTVSNGALVAPARPTAAQIAETAKSANNAPFLAQIYALESTQARPIREAALGMAGASARVKAIDDQIAALRSKLQ